MPCASACVMYSGLSPSIEIISTGAACAARAKTRRRSGNGKTKKRRTTAFMRSAPLGILMGIDEAVRNSRCTSERIPSAGEVYSVQVSGFRCQGAANQQPADTKQQNAQEGKEEETQK